MQLSEVFTKILVPKKHFFQGIPLLHCPFIMKQQASICLFIKTEFHESNSAVLKNLQRLPFYRKELKEKNAGLVFTSSELLMATFVIYKLVISIVHV